jgi:arylsulfatase A-like enzyme
MNARKILNASLFCSAMVLGLHLVSVVLSLRGVTALAPTLRQAVNAIGKDLILFQLRLLLAMAAAGFAAGLCASLALLALRLPARPLVAALLGLAGIFAIALRTLAHKPALFEDSLWRHGGLRARFSVLVAEQIGLSGLDKAALLLLVLFALALLLRNRRAFAAFALLVVVAQGPLVLAKLGHGAKGKAIVVLAADSLRPDRLTEAVAPHLHELARRSAAGDVFVPIASTTASWTSMLTGLYPHNHGVRDLFPRADVLHPPVPTLPAILAQHGFHTAVVSDYAGESFQRVQLGFELVDAPPATSIEVFAQREALQRLPLALGLFTGKLGQRLFPVSRYLLVNADPAELTDRALSRLSELEDQGAPFLLVVFYSVTHAPFAAPMPDAHAFSDPAYAGKSRYAYDIQQLDDIARAASRPSEAEVAQVRALYDGAVRSFDREVARFEERLARDPDHALVITGDHGESLFEPGATTEHGKWFVGGEAANRTPLLIAAPGVAQRALPHDASGVDFLPTLLQLAEIAPPQAIDGLSLLGPIPEGRTVFAESALWLGGKDDSPKDALAYPGILELLEVEEGTHALALKRKYFDRTVTAKLRAARQGPWELVYQPTVAQPIWRLFNLDSDRYAEHDLISSEPAVAAGLREKLMRFLAADRLRWLDADARVIPRVEQ